MQRWMLALVLACGGGEAPEARENPDESAPETSERADEPSPAQESPNAEAEAPAINLSAGPARATTTVVPQRPHRRGISDIEILGHGRAAASTYRGTVTVFDVPSGRIRAARRLFYGSVGSIEGSRNGRRLLVHGGPPGEDAGPTQVGVWDLDTDRWRLLNDEVDEGFFVIVPPAFDPEGESVAALSYDDERDQQRLWILHENGRHRSAVASETRPTTGIGVRFAPSGDRVAVIHRRGVRFHDATNARADGELVDLGARVRDAFFRPGTDHLLVTMDRGVRVVTPAGETWALEGFDHRAMLVGLHEDRVALCGQGTTQLRWGPRLEQQRDVELDCYGIRGFDLHDEQVALVGQRRDGPMEWRREGAEPVPFEGAREIIAMREGRSGWFLVGNHAEVHIFNTRRGRLRRLLAGGRGEKSAWSVSLDDSGIDLIGRGWSTRFGEAREEREATENPLPEVPAGDVTAIAETTGRRILMNGEGRTTLQVAGRPDVVLRTNGLEGECYFEYETYCSLEAFWREDGAFLLHDFRRMKAFDANGRPAGPAMPYGRPMDSPTNDRVLMLLGNGGVTLVDGRYRNVRRILAARRRIVPAAAFSEDGSTIVVVRGAALVIADGTSGEERARTVLPSPAVEAPIIEGETARVRTKAGFVWIALGDASVARRLDVPNVRSVSDAQVLFCNSNRLRLRSLDDEGEGRDLGPCPPMQRQLAFDDRFVWWTQGTTGRVVRIADGQRLTLRTIHLRRPMAIAYTPQGHVWLSRDDAMGEVKLRLTGPLTRADVVSLRSDALDATLVARFLSGEALGEAPEWAPSQ